MKRVFIISILFLSLIMLGHSTAYASITLVQHTITPSGTCSSSSNTCTLTVAATGANHAGVLIAENATGSSVTITSVTGAGTWTIPTQCHLFAASSGSLNCAYNLSTIAAATSLVVTWSSSTPGFSRISFYEYLSTTTSLILDTGTTPINANSNTTSTNPLGTTLALAGTNDVIVQGIGTQGATVSSVAAPYSSFLATTTQFGSSNNLNTSSVTPPTWTLSATNITLVNGIALSELSSFPLSVTVSGSGSVSSSPSGITCPSTCSANFTSGSTVTLTATPSSGFFFTGWAGAGCSGTGICVVTMSSAQSVTATFAIIKRVQSVLMTSCSNTSNTCTITVAATGPAHAGVIVAENATGSSVTITSVSGAGTWTIPSQCHTFTALVGSLNCAYNLNTTSGVTSLIVTWSSSTPGFSRISFYELASASSPLVLDTGSVPINANSNATSINPVGTSLTLTGSTDVIIQGIATGSAAVTTVASPYSNFLASATQFGSSLNLNTSSSTPPTWTLSVTGATLVNGLALNGGAVVIDPVFSPVAGSYSGTIAVSLSSLTSGATICYTNDGSTPTATTPGTCSHGTTYSSSITVSSSQTLQALATKSGSTNSNVIPSIYTITGSIVSGRISNGARLSGGAAIQ